MNKPYTIKLEGENIVIEQGSQQVVIIKEAVKDLLEFILKLPMSYWEGVRITSGAIAAADLSDIGDPMTRSIADQIESGGYPRED